MLVAPSTAVRVTYCLVVLGAILPVGLAASSWVAMARGPSLLSAIPILGALVVLALGGYRLYLVGRFSTTLSSPPVTGIAKLLRVLGVVAMYVGVIATILSWVGRPLMGALLKSRTESGAEFFAAGLYLALIAGIGLLGLFLFEFSRLLAFERLAHERYGVQRGA